MNNGSFRGVVLEASLAGLVVNAAEFQCKFLEGKIDLTQFHRNFATFFTTNFTANFAAELRPTSITPQTVQSFQRLGEIRRQICVSVMSTALKLLS